MLLALADFADDSGRAFPSVPTLARKCRMGERNAMYILKALQEQGHVKVHKGAARRGTNLYQLVFSEVQPTAPLQSVAPLQPGAAPEELRYALGPVGMPTASDQHPDGIPSGDVQPGALTPATHCAEGCKPLHVNPCNPLHPNHQ